VTKVASMAAGFVLAAVVLYVSFSAMCSSPYAQGVPLTGRTTISSEWLDIAPQTSFGPYSASVHWLVRS
jgi:hypothetical protein